MVTTRNKSKTQWLLKKKDSKSDSIQPSASKARQSLTKENLNKHNTEYMAHGSKQEGNSLLPSKSKKITTKDSNITEMTPRKLSRIKEFQAIDSWELDEELVLF